MQSSITELPFFASKVSERVKIGIYLFLASPLEIIRKLFAYFLSQVFFVS